MLDSIRQLCFSTPRLKLKKSGARIGDAGTIGRLTSSEALVLASSNTMPSKPFFFIPCSFFYAYRTLAPPLRRSSAGLVSANISGLADIPSEH